MKDYQDQHGNLADNMDKITDKLKSEPFEVLKMVMQALDELNKGFYYDFGESLADVVRELIE